MAPVSCTIGRFERGGPNHASSALSATFLVNFAGRWFRIVTTASATVMGSSKGFDIAQRSQ